VFCFQRREKKKKIQKTQTTTHNLVVEIIKLLIMHSEHFIQGH